MKDTLKSSQISNCLDVIDRPKRTLRLNSIVTEIPNSPAVLVNNKYIVERKNTHHALENPLGLQLPVKKISNASTISLPGSRRTSETPPMVRRSTSHDEEAARTAADVDNENAIKQYYERNNYTVTGSVNHQNTFNRLPKHRIRRFDVNRAISPDVPSHDILQNSSTPGAFGEDVVPTQRKFESSFYWFAMHRKKFGFRYIVLCLIVLLYTLFGATVFYFIEGTNEKQILRIHERKLDKELTRLADILSDLVNNPNKTITMLSMKNFIKKSYIDLQKEESQYKWSVYYRLEDPENNLKWSFASAFFFSMNVYTTTGYGSISAETIAGQTFTMVYAFIFVPLTLVILRDLGQMFLVNFTKLYAHGLTLVRKLKGHDEVDEDEMIQLPIKYCMAILAIYLFFCTTTVYLYDAVMGPAWNDGLQYFTAFYFSFISLTTIGLGDVMPNNVPYAPPISIIFFLGMAVIKVVNRATYIAVENGVFGCMTIAENKLDQLVANVEDEKHTDVNSETNSENTSEHGEAETRNEMLNNFTVRSIATFMQSNRDVYAGGFGRVQLRRGDLIHGSHQNTINSSIGHRHTVHAFDRFKSRK